MTPQRLSVAAKTARVALAEYYLAYGRARFTLFVFVEGRTDYPFYAARFADEIDCTGLKFLRCGNRNGVLRTRMLIEKAGCLVNHAAFLIDRDLDPEVNPGRIYESQVFVGDRYSIENYLAEPEVFGYYLTACLLYSPADTVYRQWAKRYRDSKDDFCRAIAPIMAFICGCRWTTTELNLQNVNLLHRVIVGPNLEITVDREAELLAFCDERADADMMTEFPDIVAEFQLLFPGNPPGSYNVRGKYMLWHLIECIKTCGIEYDTRRVPGSPHRNAIDTTDNGVIGWASLLIDSPDYVKQACLLQRRSM